MQSKISQAFVIKPEFNAIELARESERGKLERDGFFVMALPPFDCSTALARSHQSRKSVGAADGRDQFALSARCRAVDKRYQLPRELAVGVVLCSALKIKEVARSE